MSTNNLLGATTKDDIKVGYIDPTLGYVTGISVCQANEYAKKNPGTVFIFKNGNGDIKYLRINEVNKLNPKDLVSTASTCGGIKKRGECGPPTISFYGGGGVGAKANPVVGTDGAILAVDVVAGGFAYQYPPITQVDDFCFNGSGTVLRAILGSTPDKIQTYENEADFEEYELCDISEEEYGNLYDKNGKVIGKWNPKTYTASPGEDPIQKEIEKYQKFLRELKKPFWHTRKKQPFKISAEGKNYDTAYPVSHPCSDELVGLVSDNPQPQSQPQSQTPTTNAVAEKVEVEFQVRRDGGDDTKYLEFVFTSSDGNDRFVLKSGDENKKTYKVKKNVLKNVKYTIESRITNEKKTEPKTVLEKGLSDKKNKEIGKDETGNRIFTDFVKSGNDNDDLRVTLPSGGGKFISGNKTRVSDGDRQRSTYELFYIFEGASGKPAGPTSKDFKNQKTASNPKFIKRDGKFYLDVRDYSGKVELDFEFIIRDNKKGGSGFAALRFEVPGTDIVFDRRQDNKIIKKDDIVKTFTVNGGKLYGPIKLIDASKGGITTIKSENTLSSLDPGSAKKFKNTSIANKDKDLKDFDIIIRKAREEIDQGQEKRIENKEEQTSRPTESSNPNKTWNDFMNNYAVSPVSKSNVPGSDNAGKLFTMEWQEEFPYDGDYIFRGLADNRAKLYLDNEFIADLKSFADVPNAITKTVKGGVHNIRVDLLNLPAYKAVSKFVDKVELVEVEFEVYGAARDFDDLSFSFISEDGQDSFTVEGARKNKEVRIEKVKVRPNIKYKVQAKEDSKRFKAVEQGIIQSGKKNKEGGTGSSNKIFADYVGSSNDNNDIQITTKSGTFTTSNKRRVNKDGTGRSTYDITFEVKETAEVSKTNANEIRSKNVFNTVDYIAKANRKLWRTNASASKNDSLIHRLGIAPFDTTKPLENNPYAGVHTIIWENVDFPIDGNYRINIAVDDNVKLFIGNAETGGSAGNRSGLSSIAAGGDEVIIDHKGFPAGSSRALPDYSETKFFKKGKYRIRAELEQIPGGKFQFSGVKGSNPMALAIDITTDFIEKRVVSSKSWCENPMGVALTIDAPPPPIPQETPPPQDGPCPPNPIWSSRFPNGSSKWYPVRFTGGANTITTSSTQTQTESVRPKFIKDKKDGKYYLDLREYNGEVNIDMEFLIKDTKKGGGGFAGTAFEIKGTSIKFDRTKQSGKTLTDAVRSKSFTVAGGKLYGPVKFLGADAGSAVDLRNPYQIRSLDKKSAKNLREGDLKDNIDFNVVIKGATVENTTTTTKSKTSKTWSKFMNRYAVSPVLPLNAPGSDKAGIEYSNTWTVNIPTRGYYGVQVLADNKGRILIDGNEVAKSEGFNIENPKVTKVLLTEGSHTITAEVINTEQFRTFTERAKIFSTQDWATSVTSTPEKDKKVEVDFTVYGAARDFDDLSFSFVSEDGSHSFTIENVEKNRSTRVQSVKIIPNVKYKVKAKEDSKRFKAVEQGIIQNGKKNKEGGIGSSNKIFADYIGSANDNNDIQITAAAGEFTSSNKRRVNKDGTGRSTFDLTFVLKQEEGKNSLNKSATIQGVTYKGPPLFHHKQTTGGPNGKGWSDFMNKYSVSPKVFNKIDEPDERINGTFILTWKDVSFPETGDYNIKFQADNIGVLKIDDEEVYKVTDFASEPNAKVVNVTQGKHDITIELTNIKDRTDIFLNNPMGVSLTIDRDITKRSQDNVSWNQNPMGLSAILIPPPCAKKINGRGVIEKVIVEEPGNGYLQPSPQAETYPVLLRLTEVVVINPGINYNCGVDVIKVVPDNGAKLSYSCESFGRITSVKVEVPGEGFTSLPRIIVETPDFDPNTGPTFDPNTGQPVRQAARQPLQPTGVNFEAVPVFEVVRDPIEVEPERLIQVTDLAGLKQTGYVDGRAYYGAVFYEDGVRYAGYYRTPGQLVRVYDTLQESITGRVTTSPSAIQRSGTDITSNDPRLNIPGTPGNPQQ